ncbi:MAG: RNA-binding protein [Thermoprotei archaeon]|nr:MAG: RNA-binding protein [Thermofilum sp. ex4484_79]RLE61760.1 MAG: RNA-binding protein [Thermoprotei archaeon]HDD63688.1 RNA-binding protein [Thermoprotei archaeon]
MQRIKREGIVVPGDRIAVIEEFFPGENTYVSDGNIYSKIVGKPEYSLDERIISVIPLEIRHPLIPRRNDIVYARVRRVKDYVASLEIFEIVNKGTLSTPFSGILHVTQVSSTYVKTLFDVIRAGDIVKAKVLSDWGPPYFLTIKGRELGVIYALCVNCMLPLIRKGYTLICPKCRSAFKRKISFNYINIRSFLGGVI